MKTYLEIAADPRTLYQAFLKARTWCWEQPYYDVVEIKLFEWRLSRNIAEISRRMRDGYRFDVLTGYHIPKDISSARKYAYRSFIDEIATTSAAVALGPAMERKMDRGGAVSFGNRLDLEKESDRLYIPWNRAWEALAQACQRAGRRSPWYLRTDVKKFYPEIPLKNLDQVLRNVLPFDPIYTFLASMNHVPCPFLSRNRGIPAGPAISGFIANLYLLPLDREIKEHWKSPDDRGPDHPAARGASFRRYVDDIFFFSPSRSGAVRARPALSKMLSTRFGLTLHDSGKSEIKFSRDPLGAGESHSDSYAETLFDRVYGSIYRLNGALLRRFQNNPEQFLKWYSRGLRWLGIFVSTDWLAQRLLTVAARGKHSRWLNSSRFRPAYRLNFPDIELFGIEKRGTKKWAEEFSDWNPAFMRDVAKLHRLIGRETRAAYKNLGDVRRQSKKELKSKIFSLRTFASRMAMMRCDRLEHLFRMLMDHPWILDPALCVCAFFSFPHSFEKLSGYLSDSHAELVRAKAAWALGELGDRRAVRRLWETAKHGRSAVVRRSALEALLRIDSWNDLPVDWVSSEAGIESDPGIRKYYYLILGRMRPPWLQEFLKSAAGREQNLTACLALEFAAHETGSLYEIAGVLGHLREPLAHVPAGHPAERR